MSLYQAQQIDIWQYSFSGLGVVLSDVGGLAMSILGIITFILSGYQAFAFEKSAFKQIYRIEPAEE